MYHFVKSIKSNEMIKFKDYFRNTDVLLIDDIQFMNGKEALQEEFFHTFSTLLDKGSQIVLTSDRPPNKLNRIQDRIKVKIFWRFSRRYSKSRYRRQVKNSKKQIK